MTVKIQAELTAKDNLSPKLGGVETALNKFKISVEENQRGIRKFENSLENFGVAATGLQGNLGRVADALIEFTPGGMVGLAVITGISALIFHFQDLAKAQDEAKKSADDLRLTLIGVMQGEEALAKTKYLESLQNVTKAEQELRDLRNKAAIDDANALARAQARVGAMAQPVSTIDKKKEAELVKARNDALNTSLQLGKNFSALEKARIDKDTEKAKQAEHERTQNLKKAADERNALQNYSNDLRIKNQEEFDNFLDKSIKNAEEAQKAAAERAQNFRRDFGIDDFTTKVGEDIAAQFAPGGTGMRQIEEFGKNTKDLLNTIPLSFEDAFKGVTIQFVDANSKAMDLNSTLGQLAGITLVSLQDGFAGAFEAIGQGENALNSLGKAAQRAVAKAAAAEGQLAFGRGLVEVAKAIAGDPVAALSAIKYFAAGAFLSTLAGALGGSGGARGGGGGGGAGGIGGTNVNSSRLGSTEGMAQGYVYINLTGGSLLDMSNIDTQRSFLKAIETLTNKRAIVIGG